MRMCRDECDTRIVLKLRAAPSKLREHSWAECCGVRAAWYFLRTPAPLETHCPKNLIVQNLILSGVLYSAKALLTLSVIHFYLDQS